MLMRAVVCSVDKSTDSYHKITLTPETAAGETYQALSKTFVNYLVLRHARSILAN